MPDFVIGLDLGQTSDPTALAVLRRTMVVKDGVPVRSNKGGLLSRFIAVHLQRFPLGTSYPSIVKAVCKLVGDPRVKPWKPRLAVDATGVGRAVMDMLIAELLAVTTDTGSPPIPLEDLYPITITAGVDWSPHMYAPGVIGFHVPKVELASTVQAGLGSNRLEFAQLRDKQILEQAKTELKSFKVKTTKAANQTFSARDGEHDDIVLAIAVAMWLGSLPRIGYRTEADVLNAEYGAKALTEKKMQELEETGDTETKLLVSEYRAETKAMEAEKAKEKEAADAAHEQRLNPDNDADWFPDLVDDAWD